MDKKQLDELYHNLRKLCIEEDSFQKDAIAGITMHLTQPGGDYIGLLRFLAYYGAWYVLPVASKLVQLAVDKYSLRFLRIVELGAGFAWLSRGLSKMYNLMPTLNVDKRQWVFTDVVADIETKNGIKRVLDELKAGDFVVMSDLLHCLDDPRGVLQSFVDWPVLVIEYSPFRKGYRESYSAQLRKFGCKPLASVWGVLPKPTNVVGSTVLKESTDTHELFLYIPPHAEGGVNDKAERRELVDSRIS